MFCGGKKGSKRGQFTLFVIVGLVILFVFGFAFYARIQIIQSSMNQQADAQLKDYLNKNAINQYVTSCLDAVVDEVFLNASMTGGRLIINGENPGTPSIEYYDSRLGRTYDVATTIGPNTYEECPSPVPKTADNYIVTQEPGLYPFNCRYEKLDVISRSYKIFGTEKCFNDCTYNNFWSHSGFFGINKLKPLCDGYGANAPGIVSNQNFRTCDYYDYRTNSLQESLQLKISEEIKKCINFTEISKRSPSNISIDENNVKTTVIFGREEFDVRLEYPFTITVRNRQPVTKMVNFTVNRQLPFKELYEYAYELSNTDVTNVIFDMFYDKDKVRSKSARRFNVNIYNSNFMINVIRGDASNGYTDLVQVIDTKNNILGVPLTINFGVKNRRPALDYIHEGSSEMFDLAATEDSMIQINPAGFDPDGEASLKYTYSGWREDYIEKYNYEDDYCTDPDLMTIEYVLEHCSVKIEPDPNAIPAIPVPHDWTESDLFVATQKNASYEVGHDDVGFHTVTISVSDREGLYDLQTVKILVMDLPTAIVDGSNLYDDVDDGYASYEDLYVLDGTSSIAGNIAQLLDIELSKFEWNDETEPFFHERILIDENTKRKLELPFDLIAPASADIMTIVNYAFKKNSPYPPEGGVVHDILFTVTTELGLQDSEILSVQVMQCLPHRNANVPPYPYDTIAPAPYTVAVGDLNGHLMADHACCADDMTYKDSNEECFTDINYGMYDKFKDYSTIPSVSPPVPYSKTPKENGYAAANDIFKQEFNRYCDGKRGNICVGEGKDTITPSKRCDDDNKGTFDEERCSGPTEAMINGALENQETECQNYPAGKTFEKLMNNPGATGYCTGNSREIASGPYTISGKFNDPNKPDNFACYGECDGAGGCTRTTNCICQYTSQGNGNSQCDGLQYKNGLQVPLEQSCDNKGEDYFADLCNSACQLVDDPAKICKWSADSRTGCNAAEQYCNGVGVHLYAQKNGKNACLIDDKTKWTSCGETCGYESTDNVCRAAKSGEGCSADDQCDGVVPGSPILDDNDDSTSESGKYCNNSCEVQDCGAYAFNPLIAGGRCYNTCTSNSQCASGYVCGTNRRCILPDTE